MTYNLHTWQIRDGQSASALGFIAAMAAVVVRLGCLQTEMTGSVSGRRDDAPPRRPAWHAPGYQ